MVRWTRLNVTFICALLLLLRFIQTDESTNQNAMKESEPNFVEDKKNFQAYAVQLLITEIVISGK